MSEEIDKHLKEVIMEHELKLLIADFLTGDKQELEFATMYPVMTISNILTDVYDFERGETDTNGWQCDFWIPFTRERPKQTITLAGSLFYGDFALTKEID